MCHALPVPTVQAQAVGCSCLQHPGRHVPPARTSKQCDRLGRPVVPPQRAHRGQQQAGLRAQVALGCLARGAARAVVAAAPARSWVSRRRQTELDYPIEQTD